MSKFKSTQTILVINSSKTYKDTVAFQKSQFFGGLCITGAHSSSDSFQIFKAPWPWFVQQKQSLKALICFIRSSQWCIPDGEQLLSGWHHTVDSHEHVRAFWMNVFGMLSGQPFSLCLIPP
jgi:hypothetical protein